MRNRWFARLGAGVLALVMDSIAAEAAAAPLGSVTGHQAFVLPTPRACL